MINERQKIMNDDKKTTFPSKIDWKTLDEIVRKWAVLSGYEKDQNFYEELKKSVA